MHHLRRSAVALAGITAVLWAVTGPAGAQAIETFDVHAPEPTSLAMTESETELIESADAFIEDMSLPEGAAAAVRTGYTQGSKRVALNESGANLTSYAIETKSPADAQAIGAATLPGPSTPGITVTAGPRPAPGGAQEVRYDAGGFKVNAATVTGGPVVVLMFLVVGPEAPPEAAWSELLSSQSTILRQYGPPASAPAGGGAATEPAPTAVPDAAPTAVPTTVPADVEAQGGDGGLPMPLIAGALVLVLVAVGVLVLLRRRRGGATTTVGVQEWSRPGGGAQPVAVTAQQAPEQAWAAATQPIATHPAQWHPDPMGRHQLRYYDGSAWTEHVSDGGVVGTDPLNGSFSGAAGA